MRPLASICFVGAAACGASPSAPLAETPAPAPVPSSLVGAVTEVAFTVDDVDGPRALLERLGATVSGEHAAAAAEVAALTGVARAARVFSG